MTASTGSTTKFLWAGWWIYNGVCARLCTLLIGTGSLSFFHVEWDNNEYMYWLINSINNIILLSWVADLQWCLRALVHSCSLMIFFFIISMVVFHFEFRVMVVVHFEFRVIWTMGELMHGCLFWAGLQIYNDHYNDLLWTYVSVHQQE